MTSGFAELATEFMKETETPVVFHAGQVLTYGGTLYQEIDRERLTLLIRRWTIRRGGELKARQVAEVVQSLLAQAMTDHDRPVPFWLDGDGPPPERVIPFRNGLLDLATWELLPHTPDFVCPWSLPYDHDPGATCREWLATLDAVYEGDPERIGLLQEWCGYCMSSDTSQHKLLGLTGVQRSLKSTILGILRLLVGEANTAACRMASLGTRFGLQPLVGKPLAVVSEVELDADNTAAIVETVKGITGEDLSLVDRKGLPAISVKLPTRLVFAANKMPLLFDGSSALADRLLLLEHRRSWLGREDRDLPGRLAAEVEGIAVWALEGLRRLRGRGRFVGVESDTLLRFRRASASVDSFLVERCEVHEDVAPAHLPIPTTDEQVWIDKQRLHQEYVEFCDRWAIYPKSEKGFHADLAERMPQLPLKSDRPHGKPRRYRGIRVVLEAAEPAAVTAPGVRVIRVAREEGAAVAVA